MELICLCAVSFLLSSVVMLYIGYDTLEGKEESFKTVVSSTVKNRSIACYMLLMFASLCGISACLSYIYESNSFLHNFKLIVLLSVLFVVAWTDYRKYIIPNKIIGVALVVRCIFYLVELITLSDEFWDVVKSDLMSLLIVIILFVGAVIIVKNGIGMGDIKLMLIMGLFQGFYGLVSSLFLSMIVAFIIALVFLVTRKKTRKDAIPFGPSILVGTLMSMFLTGM